MITFLIIPGYFEKHGNSLENIMNKISTWQNKFKVR